MATVLSFMTRDAKVSRLGVCHSVEGCDPPVPADSVGHGTNQLQRPDQNPSRKTRIDTGTRRRPAMYTARNRSVVPVIDVILEADKTASSNRRNTARRIFERLRTGRSTRGGFRAGIPPLAAMTEGSLPLAEFCFATHKT